MKRALFALLVLLAAAESSAQGDFVVNYRGLMAGRALVTNGFVDFYRTDTAYRVRLQGPTGLAANRTFTLPATLGSSGQALTTDGAGAMSWQTIDSTITHGATARSGCVAGGVSRSTSNLEDCGAGLTYASGALSVSGATGTTVAATINNGTSTAAILKLQNGGVDVFQFNDPDTAVTTFGPNWSINPNTGAVVMSGSLTLNTIGAIATGNGVGIQFSNAGAYVTNMTAPTPDSVGFLPGATSNSWHFAEVGDFNFDFNNGPCGTSACTDPALIIHSRNQSTTEYASIQHDGTTAQIRSGTGGVTIGTGTTGTTVAATINNGTSTGNILNLQDNGTNVFTVADGGRRSADTGVGTYLSTVTGLGIHPKVRDQLYTGINYYESGVDANSTNGSYVVVGRPGTSTAWMWEGNSSAGSTGRYPRRSAVFSWMRGPGSGTTGVASSEVRVDADHEIGQHTSGDVRYGRAYTRNEPKTLTESSATNVVLLDVASGAYTGGDWEYTVVASDGTDHQTRRGRVVFAVVNKAGVETCTLSGASEAADGSVLAASAGTLAYAVTCDTSPTNGVYLALNAVSSLTQTTLAVYWNLRTDGKSTTVAQ